MADVYLILGAARSGRRECVRDLIEGGFEKSTPVYVAYSNAEDDTGADEQLTAREATVVHRYPELEEITIAEDIETAFIVTDGRSDPVDQIEFFHHWLRNNPQHELARIITVVNCTLLSEHPKLEAWYEACIHFSDVVLLGKREGVDNRWISQFEEPYKKACYPCLFELLKKGGIGNPALVLDPLPRRLSLAFDTDLDAIDFLEIDEDDLPEEPITLERPLDPYFARRSPDGPREKRLPDINEFLS